MRVLVALVALQALVTLAGTVAVARAARPRPVEETGAERVDFILWEAELSDLV